MSAILHAIATSIEDDRNRDQLRSWFENAGLHHRRLHKQKFEPVFKDLKGFEIYYENIERDEEEDIMEIHLEQVGAEDLISDEDCFYEDEACVVALHDNSESYMKVIHHNSVMDNWDFYREELLISKWENIRGLEATWMRGFNY